MSIFTFKRGKTKEKPAAPVALPAKETAGRTNAAVNADADFVVVRPHLTEKATFLAGRRVYVFDVRPSAGKREVAKAISSIFKVKPVKIRMARVPRKRVWSRGHYGFRAGGKKAYVYLKEGDKIEMV